MNNYVTKYIFSMEIIFEVIFLRVLVQKIHDDFNFKRLNFGPILIQKDRPKHANDQCLKVHTNNLLNRNITVFDLVGKAITSINIVQLYKFVMFPFIKKIRI